MNVGPCIQINLYTTDVNPGILGMITITFSMAHRKTRPSSMLIALETRHISAV